MSEHVTITIEPARKPAHDLMCVFAMMVSMP
jgi:hypothetical protein